MKVPCCRHLFHTCLLLVGTVELCLLAQTTLLSQSAVFVRSTEPTAGATYTTGDRIAIRWDASNDSPLHHFRISVSPDAAQWTILHDAIPASEREFAWNNAGPASDTTRVRIDALDANSTVLAFDESGPFAIRPGPAGSLPWPWVNDDVGAVGAPGSASYASGTFTVRGSGADIWGTTDEFHYAYLTRSGDFDIEARVTSVENVDQWTKAGLMIRNGLGPSAATCRCSRRPRLSRESHIRLAIAAAPARGMRRSSSRPPPSKGSRSSGARQPAARA